MTNGLLIFGVIFLLTTCSTIPKTNYQDKGLNFEITEDFKIAETKTWKHNHVYLNPFIILPQNISGYLSDVFIDGKISADYMLETNKILLWYSSLETPTSMIGAGFCILGVIVFVFGVFRQMEFRL